ncbi:hypothetical protein JCM6882_005028 [Rhodosporidiobolus microsporus]
MDADAPALSLESAAAANEIAQRNEGGEEDTGDRGAEAGEGQAVGAAELSLGAGAAETTAEDVVMTDTAPPDEVDIPSAAASFTTYRDAASGPPTSGLSSSLAAAEDAPLSTPELSFPPAAQPHRPLTPPRNSSYSTAVPSSASSADTLVAGTQQTTLTPSGRPPASSNATSNLQLTQTEVDEDEHAENESPDPLRIRPVPSSAASSAARSTASFRARSVSREPSAPPLQSSPTRPALQRSKTPSSFGGGGTSVEVTGENVDPAFAKGKGRRTASGSLAAGGAMRAVEEDDDELMMAPIPSGPVKPFGNGRVSPFQLAAAASGDAASRGASVSMSRSSSTASHQVKAETDDEMAFPPAEVFEGRRGSASSGAGKTEKKRGAREHTFELVVEQRRSPSLTRKPRSSKTAASASRPSSPQAGGSASSPDEPTAPAVAEPPLSSCSSHPLSQSLNARNETTDAPPTPAASTVALAPAPTSPLSSLPPSSAPQRSDSESTSPVRPVRTAKRDRRARRSDPVPDGTSSADDEVTLRTDPAVGGEAEASSSTAAHRSPKKKAKRPPRKAPLVKKDAAAPAARRRSSRGGKAAVEEEQPGTEEAEAMPVDAVEETLRADDDGDDEELRTPAKGKGKGKGKKGGKGASADGKGKAVAKGRGKDEVEATVEVELPFSAAEEPFLKKKATSGRRRSTAPVSLKEAMSSEDEGADEDADEEENASSAESADEEATTEESSSEDEDEDAYKEPTKRPARAPTAKAKAKQPRRSTSNGNGSAKKASTKEKGKGKAPSSPAKKGAKEKGKGKASQSDSQSLSSSPTKGALRPTSSFASQLFGMETAAAQTPEQRAKGWSLHALPTGKPIWVHVQKAEGGFWWPGEIDGNLWDKPLRVKLYLDPAASAGELIPDQLSFDGPTSEDVVTFRNPTKLRFDQRTFRDSPSPTTSSPSNDVFNAILELAKEKDAADEDEDDSDVDLPPPSSFGAPRASGSQKRPQPVTSDDSSSEAEVEEAESEDELLKDDDSAGIELPALCLAQAKGRWWAAQAVAFEPPSPAKKGARAPRTKPQGRFKIVWTDQGTASKTRKQLLFPMDKQFFTVKLGETEHDLPKDYFKILASFLSDVIPPFLQRIINDDYPPVAQLLKDFYAGGTRRALLAKQAAYGEYKEEVIEKIREAVLAWMKRGGADGSRPTGSARYEALTDSERAAYCADVLLATAVVLNLRDDTGIIEDVETELKEKGGEVDEAVVEEQSYKRAREQLESRSITKAVEAIRRSKDIVRKSKAQRRKEEA